MGQVASPPPLVTGGADAADGSGRAGGVTVVASLTGRDALRC